MSRNAVIENLKSEAYSLIGGQMRTCSPLGAILSAIVMQESKNILYDRRELHNLMIKNGASEPEALCTCLMTEVTGFSQLLTCDARALQVDLERYIQNAIVETGLTREKILKLTADIVTSVGISGECFPAQKGEKLESVGKLPIGMPFLGIESTLQAFNQEFKRALKKKADKIEEEILGLDYRGLEPLVEMGIPQAKFFVGFCMLASGEITDSFVKGLKLLHEAAEVGNSDAAGALGDYYFQKGGTADWNKAYEFYTGYGAVALTGERRKRVTAILNQKVYNKKTLWLSL